MIKNLKKPPLKKPCSGRNPTTGKKYKPIILDESFLESINNYDVEKYLKRLIVPSIIIQGTADMAVKLEHSQDAFSFIPQDENHLLHIVDGAPHDFVGDHLSEFINVSIEWLKKYI